MAKLSVVVPSNEVEVEGVKYRKVERKAKAGDIVKITDAHAPSYVINGAFYEVKNVDRDGDPQITDEDGDKYYLYEERFEVYEKVTEPATVEYREVNRKAEKGERIRIVNLRDDRYSTGDEFVVSEDLFSGDVGITHPKHGRVCVLRNEYVVLEPVNYGEPTPQPERLKVDEYVKVTDASGSSRAKKGDIAVITGNWSANIIDVKTLDGRIYGMYTHRFVRATESEVEAAKKALERAKNIGEFADGGYAEIACPTGSNANYGAIENAGAYVKVSVTDGFRKLALYDAKGEHVGWCNADALRKVTREEYEAATKPKPAFNVGEKVRLISGGGAHPLNGYDNGTIYSITKLDADNGSGGKYVQLSGGKISRGYAKPEQLEKVSAEEIARIEEEAKWAAIGRKVNEFKRGDIVKGTGRHTCKREIGTVQDVTPTLLGVRVEPGNYSAMDVAGVTLIVPVEQRFDRAKSPQAEGGASTSK